MNPLVEAADWRLTYVLICNRLDAPVCISKIIHDGCEDFDICLDENEAVKVALPRILERFSFTYCSKYNKDQEIRQDFRGPMIFKSLVEQIPVLALVYDKDAGCALEYNGKILEHVLGTRTVIDLNAIEGDLPQAVVTTPLRSQSCDDFLKRL